MKRYKHTLSHYRMVSANMGELFPVQCVPVLPGDTMQGSTSALIRVSPLNTPVMHPVNVRCHTFFVPNRIVYENWEKFITGGNDGQGEGTSLPVITRDAANKKSTLGYLGVPAQTVQVNALPLYATNLIFNEFYRDQDLVPERQLAGQTVMRCSWEKDYFSTARPFTQRGPDVTLPIGDSAPIFTEAANQTNVSVNWGQGGPNSELRAQGVNEAVFAQGEGGVNQLYADLTNASSININDFRAGFALQRYQEARARYGARFTEYLRYLGITPSDARLQRPEFLGGGTTRLSFSEVLQTTPTPDRQEPDIRDDIGVGDMYGHGIAGLSTGRWRKFFEEHGYVITMMSVRPKAVYQNALPREFLKRTKEDFFQKELANLGQQEVFTRELHAGAAEGEVFGYQDRYHEYRSQPSQVSQDFEDVLNTYHLARELQPDVTLNQDFVECDPSDRIFQVGTDIGDSLWCMVNNHLVARRMVPKRANPRIL